MELLFPRPAVRHDADPAVIDHAAVCGRKKAGDHRATVDLSAQRPADHPWQVPRLSLCLCPHGAVHVGLSPPAGLGAQV